MEKHHFWFADSTFYNLYTFSNDHPSFWQKEWEHHKDRYLVQYGLCSKNLQSTFLIQLILHFPKDTNAFWEAEQTRPPREQSVNTTKDNQNGQQDKLVQQKQQEKSI
jgi:hypothetical protein